MCSTGFNAGLLGAKAVAGSMWPKSATAISEFFRAALSSVSSMLTCISSMATSLLAVDAVEAEAEAEAEALAERSRSSSWLLRLCWRNEAV